MLPPPCKAPPRATSVVDSTSPTKPSAIKYLKYSISGATRAWVPATPSTPFACARHLHRDGDDVDLWRCNQLGDVGEGPRQPGRGGGRFGAGLARVGDTDDFEGLGQSAQRWNVAARGPAPARLNADDTDPEALFWHGVLFSFASPCLENTPECSMRKFGIYASDP
jgi:hypothetical protein